MLMKMQRIENQIRMQIHCKKKKKRRNNAHALLALVIDYKKVLDCSCVLFCNKFNYANEFNSNALGIGLGEEVFSNSIPKSYSKCRKRKLKFYRHSYPSKILELRSRIFAKRSEDLSFSSLEEKKHLVQHNIATKIVRLFLIAKAYK